MKFPQVRLNLEKREETILFNDVMRQKCQIEFDEFFWWLFFCSWEERNTRFFPLTDFYNLNSLPHNFEI